MAREPLRPDEGTLPIRSYEAAANRVLLFLARARAHERAGHTSKAIADINAAADIEIDAARAKRLLLPAPATVTIVAL